MVLGYLAVECHCCEIMTVILVDTNYSVWIVILWEFSFWVTGIYLFTPYFRKWEERKTKELMEKYKQKN